MNEVIKNGGLYLTTIGLVHVDIFKRGDQKLVEYVFTNIKDSKTYSTTWKNDQASFDDILTVDLFAVKILGEFKEEIKLGTSLHCTGDKLFNEVAYNFDGYDVFYFNSTNKEDNLNYMHLSFVFTIKSNGRFRNGPSIIIEDKETKKERRFHLGKIECDLEFLMYRRGVTLKRIVVKLKNRTIYAYFKKSDTFSTLF
jgi:hypothetical protein